MGRITTPDWCGHAWSRWAGPVLAITLVVTSTAAVSVSSPPGGPDEPDLAPGVAPAAGLPPGSLQGLVPPRSVDGQGLTDGPGPVTAFIELAQTPAVEVYRAERRAGRSGPAAAEAAVAARNRIERVADQVLAVLRGRDGGADELFRTVNAVPGLVVTADRARLGDLAAAPDVRSVRTVVPKATTNSNSVQLTRTLQTWQQTGRLGDGIRIGIIDDGIDYTHADFGGPGTEGAYASIDRTKVDPSYFPTAKVVGGFDFAGDDYDATGAGGPDALVAQPDPNPLACGDHGTHVAATAAGFGVDPEGRTFRGDYRKLTPAAVNDLRIGPGTAPRALLYALKVFGCTGSTTLVAQALDWSLDPDGDGDFSDRLDVVNLSLGADYGAPDDPDNLFVRKVAEHGVLPVISAGNGGDLYDIGGSPGSTPEALTVASSRDSAVLRDGAEVTAPGGVTGIKGGQYSVDYDGYDYLDRTAPVVALSDPANEDGCRPYSAADAAAVAGRHVWLEWDDDDTTRRCGSAVRADNALTAGAVGALLTSSLEHFVAGIAGNEDIPMFQFTGTHTAALRPVVEAGTLRVRLAGSLRTSVPTDYPEITDTASVFTSRGVRAPAVKPDVAAPGDTISSALTASGSGRRVISGTSMAAPHTTGIAALVRQAHPDWTVAEVKAAVMNTAGSDVYSQEGQQEPVYGVNRVGVGRVEASAAVHNQVLAMVQDDPGQVGVNFGVVQAAGPRTLRKTITVVNKGTSPARYDVAYQAVTTVPGVRYELSSESLDLAPHGVGRLTVTLAIDDPAALRRTADPTIEKIQLGEARQFLADASGRVVLTPADPDPDQDRVPLRVPVYAAPKPAADIAVPGQVRFQGEDEQALLPLSGRGLDQGSGDAAYRSLISVLQLQARSGRLPDCTVVLMVDCAPNQTARGGDIRYVGVTSTAPSAVRQGRPDDAMLAFGITTWGDWYNIGGNTIPFVDIDTTGDGAPDFEVFVVKPEGTDLLVAATVDLRVPELPVVQVLPVNGRFGDVDTGVFDTNVIVLPVSLGALGIDPAAKAAPISYTAGIAGYYTGPADTDPVIDTTAALSFDAVRPSLWFEGDGGPALSYLAQPRSALVVHRDTATGPLPVQDPGLIQGSSTLLVLHPHNVAGDRVQLVRVRTPGLLPVVGPETPAPQPLPVPPPVPLPTPAPQLPPAPQTPPLTRPAEPPPRERAPALPVLDGVL